MPDLRIERVVAREILDSRGRPTVEADVVLGGGAVGRASVPSGASTGTHEAVELRDGDPARYRGRGVRIAVANVQEVIGIAVRGMSADAQDALDRRMIDLDGTANKARLGANAILAVSLAACRAAAVARDLPLYRHIADLCGTRPVVPLPMVNLISGGLHAGGQLDIQDVLMIPTGAIDFAAAMADVATVHARLGEMVVAAGQQPLVADEGGWAPRLGSNRGGRRLGRDRDRRVQRSGGHRPRYRGEPSPRPGDRPVHPGGGSPTPDEFGARRRLARARGRLPDPVDRGRPGRG